MKKMYVHIAHNFKEAEEFNRRFWRRAGSNARFAAAWDMVKEYIKMKGKNARLLRLRRSVQNIERVSH